MNIRRAIYPCLLMALLAGCAGGQERAPEPFAIPQSMPSMPAKSSNLNSLFLDADESIPAPTGEQVARWRAARINLDLLIDETGNPREVGEFAINLFPDVVYTGVIEQAERAGDVYSWSGYLKDVELSYFTMVYTSGAFMGHFASPLGIFETAFVGEGLYRIIEIDQTKFPGGEG